MSGFFYTEKGERVDMFERTLDAVGREFAATAMDHHEPVIPGADHNRSKFVLRECRVPLTTDETDAFAHELAQAVEDIIQTETDKKEAAKEFQAQIDDLRKIAVRLKNVILQGYQWLEVACTEVCCSQERLVRVYRNDTGEEVGSRPLKPEDLQNSLPGLGE